VTDVPLFVGEHAGNLTKRVNLTTPILRLLSNPERPRRRDKDDTILLGENVGFCRRRNAHGHFLDELHGWKALCGAAQKREGTHEDGFGAPHANLRMQAGASSLSWRKSSPHAAADCD